MAYIRIMRKPPIIYRKGHKFEINNRSILPYMRRSMDLVNAAVSLACEDLKSNAIKYQSLNAQEKLDEMNNLIYAILEKWGVYRELKRG